MQFQKHNFHYYIKHYLFQNIYKRSHDGSDLTEKELRKQIIKRFHFTQANLKEKPLTEKIKRDFAKCSKYNKTIISFSPGKGRGISMINENLKQKTFLRSLDFTFW